MRTKKLLSFLLALVMFAGLMPAVSLTARAEGSGESVWWKYADSTKTLLISDAGNKGDDYLEFTADAQLGWGGWISDTNFPFNEVKRVKIEGSPRPASTRYWFYNMQWLSSVEDLDKLSTTDVTDMSGMFYNCTSLTTLDLSTFDTSKVTNMYGMFCYCSSLTSLKVTNFDTRRVTNMDYMFYECNSLTELDLSSFETPEVTSMTTIFYNCKKLKDLKIPKFDTSKITDMSWMFYGCGCDSDEVFFLDLTGFDTSNVTDMSGMFYYCTSLTTLDLSTFDTSKVTNMYGMFCYCSSLTSLKVTNFDTAKVTNMAAMFSDCESLEELDVSGFDTSNVTDMGSMFQRCKKLRTLTLDRDKFNTAKVTNMAAMFSGCESLEELDVSGFDTSSAEFTFHMFSMCYALEELDVSGFDTSKVTNMNNMFFRCESLEELDVSGFDTSQVTNMNSMFAFCKELTELNLTGFDVSGVNTGNLYNMFKGSVKLETICVKPGTDWGKTEGSVFNDCSALTGGDGFTYADNTGNDKNSAVYARVDGLDSKAGYFTAKQCAISVVADPAEGGRVSADKTQAWAGETVTVTATANSGYKFDGWYDGGRKLSDDLQYSFEARRDVELTAKFEKIPIAPVLPTVPSTPTTSDDPSEKFIDVPDGAWYKDAVDYVVEKGIMNGVSADKFAPNTTTTRAMIVTILYRLDGEPAVSGTNPFKDVESGKWYTDAIIWAAENGIVTGYGDGKFGLNDEITREQFAAILYRYAKYKGYDVSKTADLSKYSDASLISSYALDAMKWAVGEGIITGRTATTLGPKGSATRAEAAAMFMRFIEKVK